MIALSGWIIVTSFAIHGLIWLLQQLFQISGMDWPAWGWFATLVAQAILLLLPTFFLALLYPRPRYRTVFRCWFFGALFVLTLSPTHLVQPLATQAANLLRIITTTSAILLVYQHLRKSQWRALGRQQVQPIMLAITIAANMAMPWLAWGALGSALDTLLNTVAGAVFGLFAGLTITHFLLMPLAQTSKGIKRDLLLGGYAAGIFMLIATSGFGFAGMQLLLMLLLPCLGWIAAGLALFGHSDKYGINWLAIGVMIGLVTSTPLNLIDPNELSLILGLMTRDVLTWAILATLVSVVLGFGLGLFFLIFRKDWILDKPRPAIYIGLSVSVILSICIYFVIGQPGFYGDQLFVLFDQQADLTTAQTMMDYNERRWFVYRSLVNQANSSQAPIRQTLERFGIDYTPYYLVNSMAIEGGPFIQWWLLSQPKVRQVLVMQTLRPLPAQSPVAHGSEEAPGEIPWNLTLIEADRVWSEYGIRGEGIVIGHGDSGVQGNHPEISDSYRGSNGADDYNWFDPWYGARSPTDISGHGTHTLGTVVGNHVGVAPGATWIGCTNLARNLANPALYLDCLQFMLAPFPLGGDPFADGDPTLSAHVLNNSWGCPELEGCKPDTLRDAVRALRAAGIFVVVSAGNEGPACESVSDPLALYDEVFTVGAVDRNGALASFSSRGPVTADGSSRTKPDLVAPGVGILSAFPNSTYERMPGTSMAGPHVVGVVALMWSANPGLIGQIDETEKILVNTATPYQGPHPTCADESSLPNNAVGYDLLNAYEAVRVALLFDRP